jgi:hypothetical protein
MGVIEDFCVVMMRKNDFKLFFYNSGEELVQASHAFCGDDGEVTRRKLFKILLTLNYKLNFILIQNIVF